jgi:hypothetical protein
MEEDFATKTLIGKEKITCQTVQEILKTKILKPNTFSFGKEKRLSCTVIDKNYTKTYRPQGIIFQTIEPFSMVFPFDLVLLCQTENIIVKYYKIKDKLDQFYNHKLIPGYEKFIFHDFSEMIKKISSPKVAWDMVNKFRVESGYNPLPISKFRLVEYNEVVFHKPIKIKPVAIFGYRTETKKIAKELNLPSFRSAKEFYNKTCS